jgi:hypothetical protein
VDDIGPKAEIINASFSEPDPEPETLERYLGPTAGGIAGSNRQPRATNFPKRPGPHRQSRQAIVFRLAALFFTSTIEPFG